MFAVIKTGGKQYRVEEGDVLSVEKLGAEKGQKIGFDRVLLIDDGEATFIGTPVLENARVRAEVLENFKDEKILVFKKKRRKQFRRTRGHRQELTLVRIEKIVSDWGALPEEEKARLETKSEAVEQPKAEPVKAAAKKPRPKRDAGSRQVEEAKGKPKAAKKSVAKAAAKPKKQKTGTKE